MENDAREKKRRRQLSRLIKYANLGIDTARECRRPGERRMVVEYTRIFNIRQLIYILDNYENEIPGSRNVMGILDDVCGSLSTEFKKKYRGGIPMEGMDIYSPMVNEIRNDFAGTGDAPWKRQFLQ